MNQDRLIDLATRSTGHFCSLLTKSLIALSLLLVPFVLDPVLDDDAGSVGRVPFSDCRCR